MQRFIEVRSQHVIYVLPRLPQDLLSLLAINSYNVGDDFQVLSSLLQQELITKFFQEVLFKTFSILQVILSKFHSNLQVFDFYKRNTQTLTSVWLLQEEHSNSHKYLAFTRETLKTLIKYFCSI